MCHKITFVADEQVIREFKLNIELRIKKINTPSELEELIGFLKEHGGLRCGKLHDRYEIIVLQNDLVWEYPIKKMLPVICGEHLAQIKELDNPYDDKQQATFNDLIRAHLEPLLSGSNIEVESCRFYLS